MWLFDLIIVIELSDEVVEKEIKTVEKRCLELCGLMVRDKLAGTHEVVFLKQTIVALTSNLGGIVARLSATFGSGAVCVAADGPFPFGDAVAVVLAAGGTAWSSYDLYQARKHLPAELTALLKQIFSDYQAACRMEALK